MAESRDAPLKLRRQYLIGGIVQGVGFRPYVYRLATAGLLTGWIRNTPAGVELQLQGDAADLGRFETALDDTLPPLAVISSYSAADIPVIVETGFSILPSAAGEPDIQIAPDSAICPACLQELFDPTNRRYRYPFITCTNCGPRYSIITGIPYDRPKTTMADFPLCPDCQNEYDNPLDRRFHAQPIACHACGPQVRLIPASPSPDPSPTPSPSPALPRWGREVCPSPQRGEAGRGAGERGEAESGAGDAAITRAIELLKAGAILAIKGIGGYHLAVDACNHEAVARLRARKQRDEKPFAIMVKSLETAAELALLDELEGRLLSSPEAPIVIVRKRSDTNLSALLAPGNGWLGLMLPYTPLHQLLMRDNFTALVMTSGNITDEPLAFEDADALSRLAGIADYFLVHDRPIHIRSDDSVMRVFQGRPLFYRRARGYAPRAVTLPFEVAPLLAAGAELKSAICLASGHKAFLSQHIGDLQNHSTLDAFRGTLTLLSEILAIKPTLAACDLHPDYLSSCYAEEAGWPLTRVQHHHAHLAAGMAENGLEGDAIGVIFDGTGYGTDGTIWGGEFLVGGYAGYRRAAHFSPVPLPGGDTAVREPWRMALAYLYQAFGETAFSIDHPVTRHLPEPEMALFAQMMRRRINSPITSSCGRLFDAVAALLHLRHCVSYDGQAAIELEALAEEAADAVGGALYSYRIETFAEAPLQLNFTDMFPQILAELQAGISTATIARRFHQTAADAAAALCLQIAQTSSLDRVVLSGGVFQNRLLTEMLYTCLTNSGLQVFTHRLTPPNDGCIALGQAAVAGWQTQTRS